MYTKESVETFLKEQGRLYDEPVAESYEEAEEFLEDCMAAEVKSIKEVRRYLDERWSRCRWNERRRAGRSKRSICASFRRLSDRRRIRKTEEQKKCWN